MISVNNWSTAYVGAFKRHIAWIEGTDDEKYLVNNWSASIVGAFKRLILWVEATEEKNDLFINWSAAHVRSFTDLYYGLRVMRIKMT